MGRKPKGNKLNRNNQPRIYFHETPPRSARRQQYRTPDIPWVHEELKGKIKENPDGSPIIPIQWDFEAILRNAPPPLEMTLTEMEVEELKEKKRVDNAGYYKRKKEYNEARKKRQSKNEKTISNNSANSPWFGY